MDARGIGVDDWFRRCFHNCRLQDCRDGSQSGEKQPVRIIVSAVGWDTPILTSLLPAFEGKRPRKAVFGVVATCRNRGLATIRFRRSEHLLPIAGYQLATTQNRDSTGFPDVAAWFNACWTWKHDSEKLELLSGSEPLTACSAWPAQFEPAFLYRGPARASRDRF